MPQTERLVYTAKVHTTGGREGGTSRSDDGRLDIKHSAPGSPGNGTNPEKLFAAGWSTCFESAMLIAARKKKIALPADLSIDADVALCMDDDGYFLRAHFYVSLPGLERQVAQSLVDAGDKLCPYSKAVRGNVEVEYTLI